MYISLIALFICYGASVRALICLVVVQSDCMCEIVLCTGIHYKLNDDDDDDDEMPHVYEYIILFSVHA